MKTNNPTIDPTVNQTAKTITYQGYPVSASLPGSI